MSAKSAWSSLFVSSTSSSLCPRLHHLGKSPSVRPSQLRTVSASSDVLPLRTDSNSESVSPPTFPQHHKVSERNRLKPGSASVATATRWGRSEESRRRSHSRLQAEPTARSPASSVTSPPWSRSRDAGCSVNASCSNCGQFAAMASSAGASTMSRMPSNSSCSRVGPYADARSFSDGDGLGSSSSADRCLCIRSRATLRADGAETDECRGRAGGASGGAVWSPSPKTEPCCAAAGGSSGSAGGGNSSPTTASSAQRCPKPGEVWPGSRPVGGSESGGRESSMGGGMRWSQCHGMGEELALVDPLPCGGPQRPGEAGTAIEPRQSPPGRVSAPISTSSFSGRRFAPSPSSPARMPRARDVALVHQEASKRSRWRHLMMAWNAASVICVLQTQSTRSRVQCSARAWTPRSLSRITQPASKTSRFAARAAMPSTAASVIGVLATRSSLRSDAGRASKHSSVIWVQHERSRASRPKLNSNSEATSSVIAKRQWVRPSVPKWGAPFMT
mmetsp:Transcript_11681/g.25584  ORF Transcript_11681/g.25584 Transcript_11681/m.25584 type:complete len:503 (+) Transcript_11681:543-2051(+)